MFEHRPKSARELKRDAEDRAHLKAAGERLAAEARQERVQKMEVDLRKTEGLRLHVDAVVNKVLNGINDFIRNGKCDRDGFYSVLGYQGLNLIGSPRSESMWVLSDVRKVAESFSEQEKEMLARAVAQLREALPPLGFEIKIKSIGGEHYYYELSAKKTG